MATKKIEKCECENCNCNTNENLLKSIFYTTLCIFVCAFISTIFIIIIAVDKDKTNKNENYATTSGTQTGNGNGNGTTGGTETEYDVSMFTEVNADELLNLFNGSEKSLIYIGRSTCGYCVAFLPTLQQAQKNFGYQTYYYDISNMGDTDFDKITGMNSWMAENFGYTPMVIVVQNGQILNAEGTGEGWVGYSEYDAFASWLTGLGY